MQAALSNRVVVVTGGSRGIGKEFARHLSRNGAELGLIARGEKNLEDLVSNLPEPAIAVPCDVTNEYEVALSFEKVFERFGHIDAVVANAGGLLTPQRAEALSYSLWKDVLDLNLTGAFLTARTAYEYLSASKSGSLIFISSAAVKLPPRGSTAYVAAKGGVEALTKALSVEWAAANIRVNAIALGFTECGEGSAIGGQVRRRIVERTAVGRPGNVLEMARMVAFLAGRTCDYLTGQVISVDGGYGTV